MRTLYVQFTDTTNTTINGWFAWPDPSYTAIESNDPRWLTYYNAQGAWLQAQLPAPNS